MDPFAAASALQDLLRKAKASSENDRRLAHAARAAIRAERPLEAVAMFRALGDAAMSDPQVAAEFARALAVTEGKAAGRAVVLECLERHPGALALYEVLPAVGGVDADVLDRVWPARHDVARKMPPVDVVGAIRQLGRSSSDDLRQIGACLSLASGAFADAEEVFRSLGTAGVPGRTVSLRLMQRDVEADVIEGTAAIRNGDNKPGEALLRRAIGTGRAPTSAYYPLVRALGKGERGQEAIRLVREAIRNNPGDLALWRLLVSVLLSEDDVSEARRVAGEVSERHPIAGFFERVSRLSLPIAYSSEEAVADARAAFKSGLSELEACIDAGDPADWWGILSTTSFFLSYHGENDVELHRRFGRLLATVARAIVETVRPNGFDAPSGFADIEERKPRVGFISPFWAGHSVSRIAASWVTQRTPNRFHTTAFYVHTDASVSVSDVQLNVLRKSADEYVELETVSAGIEGFVDPEGLVRVANEIHRAGLDAIVYPSIGMHPMMAALASLRLAPVQVVAWGHPHTTGLETLDAFLSIDLAEPSDADSHYVEPLLRLPGVGACVARPPRVQPVERAAFGLQDGEIVYVCVQSLFKLHPAHDRIYGAIAAAVPESVIVLVEHTSEAVTRTVRDRLEAAFRAAGADPVRQLVFLPRLKVDRFRALLGLADVYLDTPEWSGGLTSYEAISVGLPIVTTPGSFLRGRQTSAMLWKMGLQDHVASDLDDYLARAVALGRSAEDRAAFRSDLTERSSDLFDDEASIGALEDYLEAMIRRAV